MPVEIGGKKAAGFDDPIGLLSDCHRRIERFLDTLVVLARARRGATLTDPERASLTAALDYFRTSGPRHTADEEESLFPRMRACADAAAALRSIEALEADHVTAQQAHAEIDELGARWLRDGALSAEASHRLEDLTAGLARLYARHIGIEDRELFPTAGRVLAAVDLRSIGEEMARRRGLRQDPV